MTSHCRDSGWARLRKEEDKMDRILEETVIDEKKVLLVGVNEAYNIRIINNISKLKDDRIYVFPHLVDLEKVREVYQIMTK